MDARPQSVRETTVARLTTEFGEPWKLGNDFRWNIPCDQYMQVNLAVDSYLTPDSVNVWVFDARRRRPHNVAYTKIQRIDELDALVKKLKRQLLQAPAQKHS